MRTKQERKLILKSRVTKEILDIIIAFILAWIFYQGLIFATGTRMPIVSVASDSMVPVLHQGDLLFVMNLEPKVGDIIVFQTPATPVTIVHRIIGINPDGSVETKGDANIGQHSYEHSIIKDYIIGKVLFAVPILGYPRFIVLSILGI